MATMLPASFMSSSSDRGDAPFTFVTQNLLSLGSVPIARLAESSGADLEQFSLPFRASKDDAADVSSTQAAEAAPAVVHTVDAADVPTSMQNVARLYQTCQQTFGNFEALKFEYIEDDGPDRRQCILTIRRPNGQTRSYRTAPDFARKSDAKARVAAIAVDFGAIDFIVHGNKENSLRSLVLARIDSSSSRQSSVKPDGVIKVEEVVDKDEFTKQIIDLWAEWRAGGVPPRWLSYGALKGGTNVGCALVLELSPHAQRVYSTAADYETRAEAQKRCSECAIKQGALEYIKYGNGQKEPASLSQEQAEMRPAMEDSTKPPPAVSLKEYFDSLPKPMPEPIGDKPMEEINILNWLNSTLQLAKGTQLKYDFYFFTEAGLHGCIFRVYSPDDTTTFLVDARFMRRADAKSAVCLKAVSLGLAQYVRDAAAVVENRVTPDMRLRVNSLTLQILGSECARLGSGLQPVYTFKHNDGAYGCTMTVSLSAQRLPEETRSWAVPPEYKSKADAKIALLATAGEEAICFVRFLGKTAPPGHEPLKPFVRPEEVKVKAEPREGSITGKAGSPAPIAQNGTVSGLVKLGVYKNNVKQDAAAGLRPHWQNNPRKNAHGVIYAGTVPSNVQRTAGAPAYPGSIPYNFLPANIAVNGYPGSATAGPSHDSPVQYPAQYAMAPSYGAWAPPHPSHGHAVPVPYYAPPPPNHYYPQPPVMQPLTPSPPVMQPLAPSPPPPYPGAYDPYYAVYPLPHPRPGYGYPAPAPSAASMNGGNAIPRFVNAPQYGRTSPARQRNSYLHDKRTGNELNGDTDKGGAKRARSPLDESLNNSVKTKRSRPDVTASTSETLTEADSPATANPTSKSQKSYFSLLLEYCSSNKLETPTLHHQQKSEGKTDEYTVWIILGKERMELPSSFPTLHQGRERLAKSVLQRLRSQERLKNA